MDWLPQFPAQAQKVGGLRHHNKLDILHFFHSVGWEAKIRLVEVRSTVDDRYQLQHDFIRAPNQGLVEYYPCVDASLRGCRSRSARYVSDWSPPSTNNRQVARKESEAVDAALNGQLWSRSSRGCYSIPGLASWWLRCMNTQFRFSKGTCYGYLSAQWMEYCCTGIASLVQLRRRTRSKYVSELQAREYCSSYRLPGSQAFLYDSLPSSIITLLLGSQLVKLPS